MRLVSALLLLPLFMAARILCQHAHPPYIYFMEKNLANHSYVDLSLVGRASNGTDAVQCRTDLQTCCSQVHGSHRGDWFFPNGTRLLITTQSSPSISESRTSLRVDLRRVSGTSGPTGIYRCDVATDAVHNDGQRETVYVGLYTTDEGSCNYTFSYTKRGN